MGTRAGPNLRIFASLCGEREERKEWAAARTDDSGCSGKGCPLRAARRTCCQTRREKRGLKSIQRRATARVAPSQLRAPAEHYSHRTLGATRAHHRSARGHRHGARSAAQARVAKCGAKRAAGHSTRRVAGRASEHGTDESAPGPLRLGPKASDRCLLFLLRFRQCHW